MSTEMHLWMRLAHITCGFIGFGLGILAIVLPKFGRKALWHRWIGRVYAIFMLVMAVLSVPLSLRGSDVFLLIIGLLTLSWVAGGWIALRLSLKAQHSGQSLRANRWLLTHIALMGSSYIGAWTAFLVNVRPFGNTSTIFWFYALGPTIIGTIFIRRATRHYRQRA